jgi:hypothetical protein
MTQARARVMLAGLLLAAAVVGIRAAVPGNGWRGPLYADPLPLGIAFEVVVAGLLLALHRRTNRNPQVGEPAAALRQALRLMLVALLLALPILLAAYLLSKVHPHLRPNRLPKTRQVPPGHPHPGRLASRGGGISVPPDLLYALIAVALIAAIVACVVLLRRRAASQSWAAFDELPDDDQEQLAQAVESGRTALREVDDARAAIIACYLAMEGSLAEAGAERGAAETPDELLARATVRGLVRGPAAERLTALFYEARFSTHPLPGSAKDDARQALDELVVTPGVPA